MIRNNLSTLMGQRKLKIKVLAEEAGLARQTVASLYHETSKMIAYDTLETLCRFFEIDVGDFLYVADADGDNSARPE